ncbi:MAG: hypothetical protein HY909_12820 [Deltaproteobacteria bacterium]|nr:hypothetical protein [Deltaproteobacteria bacterium]
MVLREAIGRRFTFAWPAATPSTPPPATPTITYTLHQLLPPGPDRTTTATELVVEDVDPAAYYVFGVTASEPGGDPSWLLPRQFAAPAQPPAPDPTRLEDAYDRLSWLWSGSAPLQTGVASPPPFVRQRASGVAGEVHERALDASVLRYPGVGVTVRVLDHPEYGQTTTQPDGRFTLAVNGGERLTLRFESPWYLTVDRVLDVPWQTYLAVEPVSVIPRDPTLSTVNMTATTVQTAAGSTSTDSAGTRTPRLLVRPGTTATVQWPDGTSTVEPTLRVRMTEYTVGPDGPAAMPAALPAASAYTYALALDAESETGVLATGVSFSQPVVFVVDNFRQLPASVVPSEGAPAPSACTVPSAWYDPDERRWVNNEEGNGRFVRVIGRETVGGTVRALLDLDGDGDHDAADDTRQATEGIDDAERAQVAAWYADGHPYWRFRQRHFCCWDDNMASKPSNKARFPTEKGPKPDGLNQPNHCAPGSIIACENRVLGEELGIAGTPFTLRYQSDRVPGRAGELHVPLTRELRTPEDLEGLRQIRMEVDVGGVRRQTLFEPATGLTGVFTWDGRLGADRRALNGSLQARIRVGYDYDQEYGYTSAFGYNGEGNISLVPGGGPGLPRVTMWQNHPPVTIPRLDARGEGFGGWSLSIQHRYDRVARRVWRGDGGTQDGASFGAMVDRLVGRSDNASGFPVNGGVGREQRCNAVHAVRVRPDGTPWFLTDDSVFTLDPEGRVHMVSGMEYSPSATPLPGATVGLLGAQDFQFERDGAVVVVDTEHRRVVRYRPSAPEEARFTLVAGTGGNYLTGLGGPATAASIGRPLSVAVAPDGALFLAVDHPDEDNFPPHVYSILRVEPGTTNLSCVVGCAAPEALTLAEGVAPEAASIGPVRLAVGPDELLYWADQSDNSAATRVRRIGPDGLVRTVFFNNAWGPLAGLTFDPSGMMYVGAYGVLFRARPSYTEHEVIVGAESNPMAWCPNGGDLLARRCRLYGALRGVAVAPDGTLLLGTGSGVTRLREALPGPTTVADVLVPASDGSELYRFDRYGQHLETLDGLTTASKYRFTYDPVTHLLARVDLGPAAENNTLTVTRSGSTITLTAPFGQATTLTLNAAEWLQSVQRPGGGSHTFTYGAGALEGLLLSETDPAGRTHTFAYDPAGRLVQDTDPSGATATLSFTQAPGQSFDASLERGGVTANHHIDWQPDDTALRVDSVLGLPGSTSSRVTPGGTAVQWDSLGFGYTRQTLGSDPRFGGAAPFTWTAYHRVGPEESPYFSQTVTHERTATMDPLFPLLLRTQTDKITRSGHPSTEEAQTVYQYTPATETEPEVRRVDHRSPAGRWSRTTLDTSGRPVERQVLYLDAAGALVPWPGLRSATWHYDARGRMDQARVGSVADGRVLSYAFDWAGQVTTVTDPLGRVLSLGHDGAGRTVSQELLPAAGAPSVHTVLYGYNVVDETTSLTPPGRSAHLLGRTALGMLASHTIPADSSGEARTTAWTYTPRRTLDTLSRPGLATLTRVYGAGGRVSRVDRTEGGVTTALTTYSYHPTDGTLTEVLDANGTRLQYAHDYGVPRSVTWVLPAGSTLGPVSVVYDGEGRVSRRLVNSAFDVAYTEDADGLLTGAGDLTITRSPEVGWITGTSLGAAGSPGRVTTACTYTVFGEPATVSATIGGAGAPAVTWSYTLRADGKLTQVDRTGPGGSTGLSNGSRWYGYDDAGRLADVRDGSATGTLLEHYGYDTNGNRTAWTNGAGSCTATYDGGDRLLQTTCGAAVTTYTWRLDGTLLNFVRSVGGTMTTTAVTYDDHGALTSWSRGDVGTVAYVNDPTGRRIQRTYGGSTTYWLYEGIHPVAEVSGSVVQAIFVFGTRGHSPDYVVRRQASGEMRAFRIVSDQLGSPRMVVDTVTGSVVETIEYDAWGREVGHTGARVVAPYGFAGGIYDEVTGIVRFGARDYDPETGRWTARDPIGFGGGDGSLYAYVLGDPINRYDPSGLVAPIVVGSLVAAGLVVGYGIGYYWGWAGRGPLGLGPPSGPHHDTRSLIDETMRSNGGNVNSALSNIIRVRDRLNSASPGGGDAASAVACDHYLQARQLAGGLPAAGALAAPVVAGYDLLKLVLGPEAVGRTGATSPSGPTRFAAWWAVGGYYDGLGDQLHSSRWWLVH